jgi:hypothetical protein
VTRSVGSMTEEVKALDSDARAFNRVRASLSAPALGR